MDKKDVFMVGILGSAHVDYLYPVPGRRWDKIYKSEDPNGESAKIGKQYDRLKNNSIRSVINRNSK